MSTRLIGWRQIRSKIDRGRTWIFAKARAGEFPAPLDLPDLPGKALWDEQQVDAWIAERVTAARERTAPDGARPTA